MCPPPSSSVVFYLFSFPATAWSNERLGLILLSPSSSSSSSFSFTHLFPCLLCGLLGFLVYFLFYYIGFIFILPPSSFPHPSLLFCDTASWDRSGRQPRSHTGQSTSHLNQSINQSVNQYINRQVNPIMLHSKSSRSLLTLQTCPHCSCRVLLLSSSLSLTSLPFLLFCPNRI